MLLKYGCEKVYEKSFRMRKTINKLVFSNYFYLKSTRSTRKENLFTNRHINTDYCRRMPCCHTIFILVKICSSFQCSLPVLLHAINKNQKKIFDGLFVPPCIFQMIKDCAQTTLSSGVKRYD